MSLSVDRQTERHAARELALRTFLQGMKARALHVAEQPLETEPAGPEPGSTKRTRSQTSRIF